MVILEQAMRLATSAHAGQVRQGSGAPYIVHLIETEQILHEELGIRDLEVRAAALLHDLLEDTAVGYDVLYNTFGPRVAGIVDLVTKSEDERLRAKRTWARLALAHDDVLYVKAADRISNLRSLPTSGRTKERMRAYSKDSDMLLRLVSRAGLSRATLALGAAIDSLNASLGDEMGPT